MDWNNTKTITLEDLEEATRGGYWGDGTDSIFPVAVNIVAIASSGRKKELNSYFKKNLGCSYYMPRSGNPAYGWAGCYLDLLRIVSHMTGCRESEVDLKLRRFAHSKSKFIRTWTFYGLPQHRQRAFCIGYDWGKDLSGHRHMWDYRKDGYGFRCDQEYLKMRMLKWYTKKERAKREEKQTYIQLSLFDTCLEMR